MAFPMLKLNTTTFAQTVKDDPEDRVQIEVGDSKQPDFKPQVKIMRWDNEVNFSLRAIEEVGATLIELPDGTIVYEAKEYEVHQYDKPDASEEGGFEFEWVLKSKPTSNVLTATIQTKGLSFYFQPPLTPEEIAEGAQRPDNIIGSYAVYHSTKSNHKVGDKNYKAGKAFHIYRPKAIDANGVEQWADLHIDEAKGLLTITVPQKFLDDAVYPVVVDPTFGYTTIGGTTFIDMGSGSFVRALVHTDYTYTASAGDSVTKFSVYGANTGLMGVAVYDLSAGLPVNRLAAVENVSIGAGAAWYNSAAISQSLSAGASYAVAFDFFPAGGEGWTTYYDTLTGNRRSRNQVDTDLPATWTHSAYDADIISIYATYTASGTSTFIPRRMSMGIG